MAGTKNQWIHRWHLESGVWITLAILEPNCVRGDRTTSRCMDGPKDPNATNTNRPAQQRLVLISDACNVAATRRRRAALFMVPGSSVMGSFCQDFRGSRSNVSACRMHLLGMSLPTHRSAVLTCLPLFQRVLNFIMHMLTKRINYAFWEQANLVRIATFYTASEPVRSFAETDSEPQPC